MIDLAATTQDATDADLRKRFDEVFDPGPDPERGPASVLCVVDVTKSQSATGFGCKPAATSPAKCAMSHMSSASTSSAIFRNSHVSTVRGYALPPQTISFGRTSFACRRTSS